MEAARRVGPMILAICLHAVPTLAFDVVPSRLRPRVDAPSHRLRVGGARPLDLPGLWHTWLDLRWWDHSDVVVASGAETISAGHVRESRLSIWVQHHRQGGDLGVRVVGSTLSVYPAAYVPIQAQETGASYVIVNQGPTEHDYRADVRIEGAAGDILTQLVAALT